MRKIKSFFTFLGIITFTLILVSIAVTVLNWRGNSLSIKGDKIGVIKVYGVIKSADKYLELLDEAENDKKIKAIVLRVNSPGGVVGACQEIYNEVKKITKRKPVVVSMGSVAASGGLYISVPATKIVANPGTITGSIGVILQTFNFSSLINRIGIKVVTIKSGPYKDILNPFESPNSEHAKIVQKLIEQSYNQFVKAVADGRKIPVDKVKELADGRIFTGEEAKKLGLVDYLGNFDKAVEIARKLAKRPKAKIYYLKRKKGFIERILGERMEELISNLLQVLNGNVEETQVMYIAG